VRGASRAARAGNGFYASGVLLGFGVGGPAALASASRPSSGGLTGDELDDRRHPKDYVGVGWAGPPGDPTARAGSPEALVRFAYGMTS
jgi:hypothetical protein